MRKEYQKAKEMRLKGSSYAEIAHALHLPKSTLSLWFAHEPWSQTVRKKRTMRALDETRVRARQLPKAIRQYWQRVRTGYQTEAIKDFLELSKQALFLAGITLYWSRGDSSPKNSQVRFTSSDPDMVKLFYVFLIHNKLASHEQIKMRLMLYPDLIESVQKKMWSRLLGISDALFQNSIIIKREKKSKRFSSGSCMILVHSRKLKEKLLKWIELYQGILYTRA